MKAKEKSKRPPYKTAQTAWGLPIYIVGDVNEEWAVGTVAEARKACERMIRENLFSFDARFIVAQLGIYAQSDEHYADLVKAIESAQEKLPEHHTNALIDAMLAGGARKSFVDAAIAAYSTEGSGSGNGVAHFLARYDGVERVSDEIPGLPKGKLAYRMN